MNVSSAGMVLNWKNLLVNTADPAMPPFGIAFDKLIHNDTIRSSNELDHSAMALHGNAIHRPSRSSDDRCISG